MHYKMNNSNWKVKAISLFCQIYFVLFSTLTLIILLNVTIPTICARKEVNINMQTESCTPIRHKQLNFVALFAFFNTVGNYICLRYKARLSSFRCSNLDAVTTFSSKTTTGIVNDTTVVARPRHVNVHSDAYKINAMGSFSIHITSDNSIFPYTTFVNNTEGMQSCKHLYKADIEKTAGASSAANKHWDPEFVSKDMESMRELCLDKNMNTFYQCSTSDWHLCRDCNMMTPPRAKHCPLCHHCVLKRDHHCFFADCCVGYHNQRYFISFCLYGGLGALFSTITMSYYLDQHYTQLQTLGYISYFPPVVLYSWLHNNSVDSFTFAMLIFQYSSVVTTLFCFYLCTTQFYLACSGLTMYEYMKSIHKYRAALWKNIHSVFGRYWFIGLVIPAPWLGYVSDGIKWDNSLNSKLL